MSVCTRFAPSPTGFLHVGSARTALYCWLYAKRCQGKFILRIEDTDRERSTQEAVDVILEAMHWLGLAWDEGPYYQTLRFDRYKAIALQLLQEGKAYRCYCSKERLEALRETQTEQKEKPRYDGLCRNLEEDKPGASFVIRFKNPESGTVEIDDCVRGKVLIQNAELDDLIIYRSDDTPTYNFSVVVDDWDMQVTHVIRGDDHLNNTPRQINILKALGATPPIYAHVPMILGDDGKRLSKRHGAVSVMQYRDEGFLPEALLNYLVRLGWSHGDQEIFTIEEMIEYFDLSHLNRAPAAFNTEKLLWLNQQYIKVALPQSLVPHLKWQMEKLGVTLENGPPLEAIIQIQQERAKTLKEMAEKSLYFYQEEVLIDQSLLEKHLTAELQEPLKALAQALQSLSAHDWTALLIHEVVIKTAEQFELKLGKLAQPLRVLLTGGTVSPPIDVTIELMGQKRVLARLSRVLV